MLYCSFQNTTHGPWPRSLIHESCFIQEVTMIFVAMMLVALVGLGTQIEVGKKTVVKSVIAMIE